MRRSHRTDLIRLLVPTVALLAGGCGDERWVDVPDVDGAVKSTASVRAERRAYDGAPPVIPHADFGADCSACHDSRGISVVGVGYAPASPHETTTAAGNTVRCRQCHVFATDDGLFVSSDFIGLVQDVRPGGRFNPIAPPTIPHRVSMRENCVACHTGPGARQEITTSHPERARCMQCHVPETTRTKFQSALGEGYVSAIRLADTIQRP
jgi:nitrate reductase cytochrome c-type subunit